jgi:hypothetical protein
VNQVVREPPTRRNNKEMDHTLRPVSMPVVCAYYGSICAQGMSLGMYDQPGSRLANIVAEQCLPRSIVLPAHVYSGGETVIVWCVPGKVDSKHRLEGGS